MRDALLAALPTGLATGLGALPFLFLKKLPRRAFDFFLGLGAGLMLAAATFGLLAEALHDVRTPAGLDLAQLALIVGGFVTGVAIAMAMHHFLPHGHAHGHHEHIAHETHEHDHDHPHVPAADPDQRRQLFLFVGALSIHRIPEGLAIGAGFATDEPRLGWLLAVVVALQNVCEGMVMGAPMRASGLSAGRSLLLVTLTGLTIPAAAVIGQSLSGLTIAALPFVLSLAGGTLIYVTSNEIIPESHSHGHEGTASTGVITGFLVTMLLGALIH